MLATVKYVAAGTRVKVRDAGPVPAWSEWENDGGRISTPVKKKLQKQFFSGDKRVTAEVIYVGNESERDKLRNLGRVKVELRDQAGSMLIITAPSDILAKA